MAATFGLLSALNIGSLHAADITWHPGVMLNKAGTPRTETAPAGMFTLTSQGYAIRNYVFLGWSERRAPIVKTYGAESRIHTLHRVGESLSVSQNTTLYAVWATDANNNGIPDYAENRAEVKHDSEFIRRTLADLEAKRRGEEAGGHHRTLRAGAVSLPARVINDDLLAYEDHIYMVGCVYNTDTVQNDLLVNFPDSVFRGVGDARATRKLELVFEYGGVLGDSAIVGGKDQKRLSRLPIAVGDTVTERVLFGLYPMMITDIKGEGEAVLKMYFALPKTGNGPDTLATTGDFISTRIPNPLYEGRYPFVDKHTGLPTDTAIFRFYVYNRPEFASNIIRSRVYYGDTMRLNYNHLSGLPTKYMMRSLDGGWNWHPADSPLTDVERDLLQDDSVRVCLRELDEGVGWAAFLKSAFLDPERFPYSQATGAAYGEFRDEYTRNYYWDLYNRLGSTLQGRIRDTVSNTTGAYYQGAPWGSLTKAQQLEQLQLMFGDVFGNPTPFDLSMRSALSSLGYPGSGIDAEDIIDAQVERDYNTVYGKRLADAAYVPPYCNEGTYCFYVKRDAPPVHQRSVFIPTVEGVTVVSPGVGYTSIPSQKNFTFRVKYTGEPMTVTAKRLIDGRTVEVLTGTLNADGEYEYVIRRVMQDLTLEFTKTVANTLVDQPSVWANSGAVRIHAPKETTVRIYSASGVLVKQATVQGDKTVPLSAGLYLVVLSDGTTQKVLVQ